MEYSTTTLKLSHRIEPFFTSEHEPLARRIQVSKINFDRICESFTDEDACYTPAEGMLTVVGQILHVTLGFSLLLYGLFDKQEVKSRGVFELEGERAPFERGLLDPAWTEFANSPLEGYTLNESLAVFASNLDLTAFFFGRLAADEVNRQLPDNFLSQAPITPADALDGMLDHTAHHRGALTQYARLLGRDPKTSYFDAQKGVRERDLIGA